MGRKDVAAMAALTQAGLAQIRIERFRGALLHIVIESAFSVFGSSTAVERQVGNALGGA
jgi:hypothetical protein